MLHRRANYWWDNYAVTDTTVGHRDRQLKNICMNRTSEKDMEMLKMTWTQTEKIEWCSWQPMFLCLILTAKKKKKKNGSITRLLHLQCCTAKVVNTAHK